MKTKSCGWKKAGYLMPAVAMTVSMAILPVAAIIRGMPILDFGQIDWPRFSGLLAGLALFALWITMVSHFVGKTWEITLKRIRELERLEQIPEMLEVAAQAYYHYEHSRNPSCCAYYLRQTFRETPEVTRELAERIAAEVYEELYCRVASAETLATPRLTVTTRSVQARQGPRHGSTAAS